MTRVCAEEGCITNLSASNVRPYCRVHQQRPLHSVPSVLFQVHLPYWGPQAPCAGRDTDMWFTDDVAVGNDFPDTALMAMRICSTCPLRVDCLTWAFDREQLDRSSMADADREEADRRFGIFGGIPGRIRERYANEQDRIAKCFAWFDSIAAARGWNRAEEEETA